MTSDTTQGAQEGRAVGSVQGPATLHQDGTLDKARGSSVISRNQNRLAEKWYMAISRGHTPENSTYAKQAVQWIDAFLEAKAQL